MSKKTQLTFFKKNVHKLERAYQLKISRSILSDLKAIVKRLEIAFTPTEATAVIENYIFVEISALLEEMYLTTGKLFFNNIQKELRPRKFQQFEDYVNEFMQLYAAEKVQSISDTLKKILNDSLLKSFNEGLSVQQAAKNINNLAPEIATRRALVIARTEIIGAANYGTYTGAEQVAQQFPEVGIKKSWFTNIDGRERAAHRAANGQTVEMNEIFIVNGEEMRRPHDPNGSASNVIQCRCTLLFQRTNELN